MPGCSRLRRFAGALLAALPLLLPGSLSAQTETGAIIGEIRIARGAQPPNRIKVSLHTRGIMVDTVYTDDSGRFFFQNLPGNPYTIVIQEEGYRPIEERVTVTPSVRANNIVFLTLQPVETKQEPAGEGKIEGGNPRIVDVAAMLERYPSEVRKEYQKGLKAEQKGKHDEAIDHYRKAISLAPEFYPARNNLGSLLITRAEYPLAQAEFEAVILINQNDAAAYLNLGNVFLLTKRYDDALGPIQEGLRKQPDHPFGHFLLGTLYGRMGRFPECEHSLREALRLDPTMSKPHLELVNLYLHQQRTADAITELRQFMEVFPQDPLLPRVKEVLARLEGPSAQPQKP
ncbi:MAG: tetratricopeptide repeat protein [Terriglobales bacterium]